MVDEGEEEAECDHAEADRDRHPQCGDEPRSVRWSGSHGAQHEEAIEEDPDERSCGHLVEPVTEEVLEGTWRELARDQLQGHDRYRER